jgi:hypothetical protein
MAESDVIYSNDSQYATTIGMAGGSRDVIGLELLRTPWRILLLINRETCNVLFSCW